MTNLKTILVACVSVLVAAPVVAHADRQLVAVMPVSGSNVHEGYLQATQGIVRAHLESTGKYVAGLAPGRSGPDEIAPTDAIARAREMNADLAVVVHVARVGNVARVRLAAYDVQTGHLVHVDELAAGTPDDLDPVLSRLAKGLATGKRASDSADIYTVTEKEADPLIKQTATSTWGLKIGGVIPVGGAAGTGEETLAGLGVFWLYDMRTFLAELAVDFHSGDGSGDFEVGLGAFYPLSTASNTPYVGGGVQYKISDYGDDGGGNGVAVHGSIGMLFGRISSVQLRAELSYFVNTYDEDYRAPGVRGRGNGVQAAVGIGF